MSPFSSTSFGFITKFLDQSRDAVLAVRIQDGSIVWANHTASRLLENLCRTNLLENCRLTPESLQHIVNASDSMEKQFVDIRVSGAKGTRSVSLHAAANVFTDNAHDFALMRMEQGDEFRQGFESIFNSLEIGIALRDSNTFSLVRQNPKSLEYTELMASQLGDEPIRRMLAETYGLEIPDVAPHVHKLLDREGRIVVEQPFSLPNGQEMHISLTIQRENIQGQDYVVTFAQDVSQRTSMAKSIRYQAELDALHNDAYKRIFSNWKSGLSHFLRTFGEAIGADQCSCCEYDDLTTDVPSRIVEWVGGNAAGLTSAQFAALKRRLEPGAASVIVTPSYDDDPTGLEELKGKSILLVPISRARSGKTGFIAAVRPFTPGGWQDAEQHTMSRIAKAVELSYERHKLEDDFRHFRQTSDMILTHIPLCVWAFSIRICFSGKKTRHLHPP